MSRNGPAGQPGRAPLRRPAEADEYAGGSSGWPPGSDPQQGYAAHGPPGQQHSQGYYFPQAVGGNYGYAPQPVSQPLPFDRLPPTPQAGAPQWDPQQPRDAGHYDLGSYLPTAGYGQPEPGPFAQSADGPFRHQYAPGREHGYEGDGEYDALPDDEGEEPRRGR